MSYSWIMFLGTSSGIPSPERGLPSLLLQYQGTYILMDVGEGTQIKLIEYGIGPSRIDAILITHLHGDHIFGLPGLLQTMAMTGGDKEIIIVGPRGTRRFIETVFSITGHEEDPVLRVVEPPSPFRLDGKLEIKPFTTCHTKIESYGYVIIGYKTGRQGTIKDFKLAYTGDTSPCNAYKQAIENADILIHDATFDIDREDEAHEFGHSTAVDAATVAEEAKAKVLFLFHTSTRYHGKEKELLLKARRVHETTYLAFDGMKFYF